MDNQTNTQEPVNQAPLNQETIIPPTPVSETPITPPEPVTQTPIDTEPVEVPQPEPATPSNEYKEILNQYATNTEKLPPIDPQPQSTEKQLQDLGIATPPKTSGGFFKATFAFALIIFIIVIAALGLVYFKSQNNSPTIDDLSSKISPTPASGTCLLNDKTYTVGESFAAADACNTCTCDSQDVISCTEKACTITPTAIPTKSTTITPTKIPTKTITPTSTPSAVTLTPTPTL